jgi:acyl-CoA hydrolase
MAMAAEERQKKRAEAVHRTEIVLPGLTNVYGTMFGGKVLEMMDVTCAIAAARFCRRDVVTISSERVDFKVPIRTSMTVKVDVLSQHFAEESKQLCTTGYFNFVALDRTGRQTVPVPELIVETEDERRDWEIADQLRRKRQG